MTDYRKRNIQISFLIFFSIIGLFMIIQAVSGLYPFGNRSNLLWDEEIQYVDYFAFYRDALLGKANLGYSFSKSAGGSLIALFGYYLACPLNLFVVFFNNEKLPLFLFLLTAVKLGLSGVTAEFFLRKRFPELSRKMGILLAVSYGLMQYNMLQLSNIMWLDGVILLPLFLLAVYQFVQKDRKFGLFVAVLFSIAINWYTGYMTGLFAVCYFLYERLLKCENYKWNEWKKVFADTVRCGMIMLAGLLGSCFIFYPVFKGLQKGKQVFDLAIFQYATYDSLIDVFRGFALGSIVPTVSLYCGILFLGFFFYFFLAKGIFLKEKILSAIAVIFMFVSCWLVPLDCIWSGMRFVGSYRFRYSFIVVFLVVYLAARGASIYEQRRDGRKMAVVFAGCFLLFFLLNLKTPYEKWNLILTEVFVFIYAILFLVAERRRIFKIALPLLLGAELVINGTLTFLVNYGENQDISVYQEYVKQSQEQIQAIRQMEDSVFYRMDTLEKRNDWGDGCSAYQNESMVYGYYGLGHYSSTFDKGISKMLFDIGYSTLLDLSVVSESILPADSLFGMKYLLSKHEVAGYEKVDSIPEYNGKSVYYNPYALGLGMEAAETVYDIAESLNPFEYQNQLFSNILGRDVKIFRKAESEVQLVESTLDFHIPADSSNDLLYGYVDSWSSDLILNVDGEYRCDYAAWLSYKVFPVGNGGEEHSVSLNNYYGTLEEMTPYFYYLDQDVFEQVIEELRSREMETEIFEDGHVKGMYTADRDGVMLLTIPYDDGWKAWVNGEEVEIHAGANALTAVPISEGLNTIEMEYEVPGVKMGILLTAAGGLLFLGICMTDQRREKSRKR